MSIKSYINKLLCKCRIKHSWSERVMKKTNDIYDYSTRKVIGRAHYIIVHCKYCPKSYVKRVSKFRR